MAVLMQFIRHQARPRRNYCSWDRPELDRRAIEPVLRTVFAWRTVPATFRNGTGVLRARVNVLHSPHLSASEPTVTSTSFTSGDQTLTVARLAQFPDTKPSDGIVWPPIFVYPLIPILDTSDLCSGSDERAGPSHTFTNTPPCRCRGRHRVYRLARVRYHHPDSPVLRPIVRRE